MLAHRLTISIALACVAALASCGGGDGADPSDTGAGTETAAPTETVDPLPKLPRGWTRTVSGAGGYAIGVPPGWSVKEAAAKTTLRAPRSVVVVSITADRSDEALDASLQEYADGIALRLDPEAEHTPGRPPRAAPGYEAAETAVAPRPKGKEVEGTTAFGGSRTEVIVVRRPQLAAYPVLIASGPGVRPAELDPIANRLIGSLRGRPVAVGG